MKHYQGLKIQCEALQAIENEVCKLPKPGKHIGRGIHVDLTAVEHDKDGYVIAAPGWTLRAHDIIKHPTKEEFAFPIDYDLDVRDTSFSNRAKWMSLKPKATELPDDWKQDDEISPSPEPKVEEKV